MFPNSFKNLSKSQSQLMVQGLYLLIGVLLIVIGIQCLNAEKVATQHHESTSAPTCNIR